MKHTFLIQDRNLLDDVLEQAPWGIVICTMAGIIKTANVAAGSILVDHGGKAAGQALIGQLITDAIPGIDLQRLGEQEIERADERPSILQIQLSELEDAGEPCLTVYIESPHRRLKRERLLERQASTDELSDLSNRRAFQRNIEALRGQTLSLALIDIDHFKKVNDVYGHIAGDDLIRLIGRLLGEHFRAPLGLASRMGGDEFSVLVETSSPQEFVAQLENFRKELSETKVPGTFDLFATVSCGAVISLEPDISSRILLTIADRELYKAKDSGRNQLFWSLVESEQSKARKTG